MTDISQSNKSVNPKMTKFIKIPTTKLKECRSVVGVFTADNARQRLANLAGSTAESLEKFTVKKFYQVDLTKKPTLGLVSRLLDVAPFVVVVKSDTSNNLSPVGVVTSEDLVLSTATENMQRNGK